MYSYLKKDEPPKSPDSKIDRKPKSIEKSEPVIQCILENDDPDQLAQCIETATNRINV